MALFSFLWHVLQVYLKRAIHGKIREERDSKDFHEFQDLHHNRYGVARRIAHTRATSHSLTECELTANKHLHSQCWRVITVCEPRHTCSSFIVETTHMLWSMESKEIIRLNFLNTGAGKSPHVRVLDFEESRENARRLHCLSTSPPVHQLITTSGFFSGGSICKWN